MIKRFAIAVSFALIGWAQVASADTSVLAYPDIFGTVSFTTPTVDVSNTASIPVYLTLTLDPNSAPLVTDNLGNVSDLSSGQVNANLFGTYYDSSNPANQVNVTPTVPGDTLISNTNEGLACSGTFFVGCGGSGSAYNFNFGPGPGFAFADNLDLLPGSSTQFLFGTFTPVNPGGAPNGTYNLPDAYFFIQVFDQTDLDVNSNPLHIADIYSFGDTSLSSGFTAIVTPEPGFYGFLGLALPLIFVGARRFASRKREV